MLLHKKSLSSLKRWGWFAVGRFAQRSERPIIVLGNQKSGTTAIAALLAQYGDLSSTLDLRYITPDALRAVQDGSLPFRAFVNHYGLDFSRDLIKEPNLTTFYEELAEVFPQAQFVMIVRDPRDNIRSILDRLSLPGDLDQIDAHSLDAFNPAWHLVLDGSWLGLEGRNYIEMLANRWNTLADVYLHHRDVFHLVHFETFVAHKEATIAQLATRCGIQQRHAITEALDVQYQPRGNRKIPWRDFFGTTNLRRIEALCGSRMAQLGYTI